ncbi:LysR family transcriptional regulator [Silvimonas sp. JCM 19000]
MQIEKMAEFLGVFADVAREGSFSGAARRRGITPSSVARQIDALEAQLAAPLFIRSTRLLTLTDAGHTLLLRARHILDALADAHQEVASMSGQVSGTLRVACFPSFGKRYVIPVVSALMRQYPALAIELDLTERLADPVAERVDIVIRMGELGDSTLIATRLATQTRVLCASPAYLAAHTPIHAACDLADQRLIDKLHGADLLGWADLLPQALRQLGKPAVFYCDDFEAMRLAACEGLGVAYLPDWVVGPDIQAGELVQVLPQWSQQAASRTGIHALRALRQPSPRVTALLDGLRAHIGTPPRWAVDARTAATSD